MLKLKTQHTFDRPVKVHWPDGTDDTFTARFLFPTSEQMEQITEDQEDYLEFLQDTQADLDGCKDLKQARGLRKKLRDRRKEKKGDNRELLGRFLDGAEGLTDEGGNAIPKAALVKRISANVLVLTATVATFRDCLRESIRKNSETPADDSPAADPGASDETD